MGCNHLSEGYKQTAAMLRRLAADKTSKIKEIEQQEDESIVCKQDELSTLQADRRIINEMVADCEWTIEWLESGRRPGNKRGIERRAAYQREKLMDPVRMQAYITQSSAGSPANLSDWQSFQIEDALSRLSDRERECYVLAHGECFSFSEIAGMLGVSKGSVEVYVTRAQRKISDDLLNSLFLVG
ncbi:sigma factor-like helix-turn-helix DNA-binding protein [Paenibacillus anseongense]|uniref:sigma factor-like helix-turn-helix DNA-binding protein n=1 Tax=Paenibacillus TaxID=44249 RepID=UPI002DBF2C5C|nr:sigma factor-like helix-turn-helix DNA-binding protein [Paenibacillus anseongense]MEC0269391.1 sigma factor-like helix-turn-helix DNA-binding protein [Paenibacillus anseongense]